MPSDDALRAFLDAIHEMQDAAEFERIMLDQKPPPGLERCKEASDCIDVWFGLWEDHTALDALKADMALERLQGRYPELWERSLLQGAVDA